MKSTIFTSVFILFAFSSSPAMAHSIDFLPEVTCMQRTTRLSGGKAEMICDTLKSSRQDDPAGIGVGKNSKVGWYPDPDDPSIRDHYRTYMVFELDAALQSTPINSAFLRLSITDIRRDGRFANNSRLKVIYNRTALNSSLQWGTDHNNLINVPMLLAGGTTEFSVEGNLRIDGQTAQMSIDILPLINEARIHGTRFVLAITIIPEDGGPKTSMSSGVMSAPPAISGFRIIPKQQLSHQPAIVIDYEDMNPLQASLVCRDRLCLDDLGEMCPADCINGEHDLVPPVIEVGVEATCTGVSPKDLFKTLTPSNRSIFDKRPGALGIDTGGLASQIQNLPVPCIKWYRTDSYSKDKITLPLYYWEGGSPIDNPYGKTKKIYYRVHDNHRLAKFWIRSNEDPPNPESVIFYNTPVTNYLPNRAQGTLSKEVTLRCLRPTELTFSAWDFSPNSTHLTVRFEIKGDGQAPLIRARHSDGHIVRSNYDSVNQRYNFYAGDTLLYDFVIDSTDEIASVRIELDGQILFTKNLESCDPDFTETVPRDFHTFHDDIPAFSDREGWRTSEPGSAARNLIITVTDIEGRTSVKSIPLLLNGQSVRSSWDKKDPTDTEMMLEQEGFFVNWANGPGYMGKDFLDGISWEDMKWGDIGDDLKYMPLMYLATYGLYSLAKPSYWISFLASHSAYVSFLELCSAWCTGYAITFQQWRRGEFDWSDFDVCQKLDENRDNCSSTSTGKYCHINCCRDRNDSNQCIDGVAENEVLQYVGAMQAKMFTGEFIGDLIGRAPTVLSGVDVANAVNIIEANEHSQGNVNGKIFDKIITMIDDIENGEAHSIAPIRSQKLASGTHRVYVYDPNKEQLSYGMKCIDGSYVNIYSSGTLISDDWNRICGSFGNDNYYSDSAIEPLTAHPDPDYTYTDPLGADHRSTLDYILLQKSGQFGTEDGKYHFNEYFGGRLEGGIMYYFEPQIYHTNPFTVEGLFMALIYAGVELAGVLLYEIFDVEFEDLEEYVDNVFSLLHDFFGSTWGLITDLLKTSKSTDTSIALPNISQRFKMFYFKTPSAKRAKFLRKKADVPYNISFIGGGADTFSVTNFQGAIGEKDIFEFYPGFHRGNLALYGVSSPFTVKIMSTVEKERRTVSGGVTGVLEKQLFLASMKIHPVDGDRPELEFEWARDGSKFIMRNIGKTKVEITLNILNSFDPYLATGTEDELNELRNQLDIPNRKKFEPLIIGGGAKAEIFFAQWWNYKDGDITISLSPVQNSTGGCSCKSTGKGPRNAAFWWVFGLLALGFFFRKKIGVHS